MHRWLLPTIFLPILSPAQTVSFSEHIAPIVFNQCTSCHRPGEAAPFALMSYEDVARRGRTIAAVTQSRYMPPWKAQPASHAFRDERRLTDEQIALIDRWVRDGMPEGDPALSPPVPAFTEGWQLGEPDMTVEMPAAWTVPAEGPDIYRNFAIPLQIPEDKWVRAIELRPSARSVVHHVLFFADTTGAARRADEADPEPGFSGKMGLNVRAAGLGGWAVGQQPQLYPEGLAVELPGHADFVLQYHFHPTGKPEIEKSAIGLYFAPKAPERSLFSIQLPPAFGAFSRIDIPAGEASYQKTDSFTLPIDAEGINIGGHAHYLAKEMKMTATFPDRHVETLLSIDDWDFAWQDRYFFAAPVPLVKGTRIDVAIRWDNSAANPRNPSSPPVRVKWGEESTDEMGSVTLQVVPKDEAELDKLQAAYRQHVVRAAVLGGVR